MADASKIQGGKANLTNKGLGRPKGAVNKTTATLKEAILQAADKAHAGGIVAYLTDQAQSNPNAFMAILGKVLPMTVAGDSENPIVINVNVGGE